ncbi:MFS transporter [Bacillus sp. N3536]|nr:MFS transporter [Bacillus sp. N3536]
MKKNKNFLLLLTGQSFANLGDVFYIVSVISVLYNLTGSATISSIVPFTITSAMFVSSLFTPLFLGKYKLKTLLVWSQMGKTVLLIILGIFLFMFMQSTNYWIIFVLIAGIALLDGCANPIMRAFLPHYVADDKLVKANSTVETVNQIIQIGAWLFGGLLLLLFNPFWLIIIVSGLFLVSSILTYLLDHVNHVEKKEESLFTQLSVGWKSIMDTPVLRKIILIDILETIAGTVWIAAILYIYVEQALKEGEHWWGFINGAFFVGLLLGSIICIKYSHLADTYKHYFIGFGALLSGVLTILFGSISYPLLALVLSIGIGLFGQLKNIPQQTVIQRSVPLEKLVTVYTSLGTVGTGLFGISSLAVGVAVDLVGVRVVFIISGALLLLVSLIVLRHKRLFI